MNQGTIYRTRDGLDLVCCVQTSLGIETPYVLCAPVVAADAWGALVPRLHLKIVVDDEPFVIIMSQMVAIPTFELGTEILDADALRDDIIAAVDLLVSGF